MKQLFSMKSIVRNSVLGVIALLAFVWVSAPTPANALATCSTVPKPIMTIAISGYGTFSNSASNLDAVGSITVPYGTSLSATFSNRSIAADTYTLIDSWPGGSQTWNHMNPGSRVHATGPLTEDTAFNIYVSTACSPDPFPGPQSGPEGSVHVDVIVQAAPAPTATLTASPNPVSSGSPTTLTWTSTNATSCTATGGAGFSTGSATSGSDASSNLASQTTFSMSCTGAGGTVTKSVTVNVNAASAPTATLTASPNPVNSGSPTTLTWTSTNATSCTATGGAGFSTGSATSGSDASSNLVAQETFSMSCTGAGGSVTKSVTVNVNASPVENPATAAFTGSDPATCTVTGWGDDLDIASPRSINIYEDGVLAETVNAGATNCVGSACTFSANLSWNISAGVPHTITGKILDSQGNWVPFTNAQTSLSLTCPAEVVQCSGAPDEGTTLTDYTFNASGGSSYTWDISPTTGISPAGSSGSGASIQKAFTTTGARTVTFTSGGQSGSCVINILATPPSLAFDIKVNGSDGPIVAYGSLPTLSWTSSGADRVDNYGSVPVDEAWNQTQPTDLSGFVQISPLVRTVYSGRAVRSASPVAAVNDSVTVRVRPQCLPAGQTVEVGQPATLTAAGGNGTYAWTATGGSTASGTGSPFSTSYATEGTKTVSLVSDSLTTTCTVTVAPPASTGTIIVNSVNAQGEPFLSTWTLSGPGEPQTPGSPTASVTYTDQPAGLYNLTAASVEGYTSAIEPGAGQNLEAGDIITFTIIYTDAPVVPGTWVDLRANPTSVTSGDSSMLSWTSDGIEPGTCTATVDWSGSKADEGSESTGALTEAETYTITCDRPHTGRGVPGTVSDTVTVLVGTGDDDDDPQCSDGVDNDGDNLVDFGEEPIEECEDPQDNLESALPLPPGDDDDDVIIGACGDGFDNDGDGTIDEADSGCDSGDGTEQSEPDIREI